MTKRTEGGKPLKGRKKKVASEVTSKMLPDAISDKQAIDKAKKLEKDALAKATSDLVQAEIGELPHKLLLAQKTVAGSGIKGLISSFRSDDEKNEALLHEHLTATDKKRLCSTPGTTVFPLFMKYAKKQECDQQLRFLKAMERLNILLIEEDYSGYLTVFSREVFNEFIPEGVESSINIPFGNRSQIIMAEAAVRRDRAQKLCDDEEVREVLYDVPALMEKARAEIIESDIMKAKLVAFKEASAASLADSARKCFDPDILDNILWYYTPNTAVYKDFKEFAARKRVFLFLEAMEELERLLLAGNYSSYKRKYLGGRGKTNIFARFFDKEGEQQHVKEITKKTRKAMKKALERTLDM